MAKVQGVSPATIQRIWDAHGLQPHRVERFKLSTDPLFIEKVRDIAGLDCKPRRSGAGVVHRRAEPDPGAGPHAAGPADEEGTLRDDDSCLQVSLH